MAIIDRQVKLQAVHRTRWKGVHKLCSTILICHGAIHVLDDLDVLVTACHLDWRVCANEGPHICKCRLLRCILHSTHTNCASRSRFESPYVTLSNSVPRVLSLHRPYGSGHTKFLTASSPSQSHLLKCFPALLMSSINICASGGTHCIAKVSLEHVIEAKTSLR